MPVRISRRGGGGFSTSSPSGRSRVSDPLIPFDERIADAQGLARDYRTDIPTGGDYAAQRVAQAQDAAARELARLQKLQADGVNGLEDRIEQLNRIANPSNIEKFANTGVGGFIFGALEKLDRGAGLIRLLGADLVDAGEKEITPDAYWDMVRGDRESLVQKFGVDAVGRDGSASFSTILGGLGWDEAETTPGRIARGLVAFTGEAALDPLSYVSLGGGGLSKGVRASRAAAITRRITGTLKEALELGDSRVAQAIGKSGDNLFATASTTRDNIVEEIKDTLRRVAETGKDETGDFARYVGISDPAEVAAFKGNVDLIEGLWNDALIESDAIGKASAQVGSDVLDAAGQGILTKDFDNAAVRLIADAFEGDAILKGGARLRAPFGVRSRGQVVIPGTRGLGRKIRDSIVGHSVGLGDGGAGILGKVSNMELWRRSADWVIEKLDSEKWLRGVMSGDASLSDVLKVRDTIAEQAWRHAEKAKLRQMVGAHENLYLVMRRAGMTAEDQQRFVHTLGRVQELGPEVTIDEIRDHMNTWLSDLSGDAIPESVAQAGQEWMEAAHYTVSYLGKVAVDEGVIPGELAGYMTHHMLSADANELMDIMLDVGVLADGDTWAAQTVNALLEARREIKAMAEGQVLGEAAAGAERTIGRTVTHETGSKVIPTVIGDGTVFVDRRLMGATNLTVADMNDAIVGVLKNIDNERVRRFLAKSSETTPFAMYNDNPFEVMTAYAQDMSMAIQQRQMLQTLKEVGLVTDGVFYVNRDLMANQIVTKLGRYGDDIMQAMERRTGEQLDRAMDLARAAREGSDELAEELDVVLKVGDVEVRLPSSVIGASKDLKRRMSQIRSVSGKAQLVQARHEAVMTEVYNAALRAGAKPHEAAAAAAATAKRELKDIYRVADRELRAKMRRTFHVAKVNAATQAEAYDMLREEQMRVAAQTAALKQERDAALAKVQEALTQVKQSPHRSSALAPVESRAGLQEAVDAQRKHIASEVRAAADELKKVDLDLSTLLGVMADELEAGQLASLEVLGRDIREAVASAVDVHRAWQQFNDVDDLQLRSFARFTNQVEWMDGQLDKSNWSGITKPKYVYHVSSTPTPARLSGMVDTARDIPFTVNAARASAHTDGGYVLVYSVRSMPSELRSRFTVGQDVNTIEDLRDVIGQAKLPDPVAIIPAPAFRQATYRNAFTKPGQARNKAIVSAYQHEVFAAADQVLDIDPDTINWRAMGEWLDSASQPGPDWANTPGSYEFLRNLVFDADLSPEGLKQFVDEVVPKVRQLNEWVSDGGKLKFAQRGTDEAIWYDVRQDPVRKGVLSAWHDAWKDRFETGTRGSARFQAREVGSPEPFLDDTPVWMETSDDAASVIDPAFDPPVDMPLEEQLAWARRFNDHAYRSLRRRGVIDDDGMVTVFRQLNGNETGEDLVSVSLTPSRGTFTNQDKFRVPATHVRLDTNGVFPSAFVGEHELLVFFDELEMVTQTARPGKGRLHQMKPSNLNRQKVMSYFDDEAVGAEAWLDLERRMQLAFDGGAPTIESIAEAQRITSGLFGGDRHGILGAAEQIFDDPQRYGTLFQDPEVQSWWIRNAADDGRQVTFTRIWLEQQADGRWVRGMRDAPGSVPVTVPATVNVERYVPQVLTQNGLKRALRAADVTATEAFEMAEIYQARLLGGENWYASVSDEMRALSDEADELFSSNPLLFDTITGLGDDVIDSFDEAARLSAEISRRSDKTRRSFSVDRFGTQQRAIVGTVEYNLGTQLDEAIGVLRMTPGDAPKGWGFNIHPRQAKPLDSGYVIGTRQGQARYAADTVEDALAKFRERYSTWVRANFDTLRRTNARIIGTWDGSELTVEIGVAVKARAEAKQLGLELDTSTVYNAAKDKVEQLPVSERVLRSRIEGTVEASEAERLFQQAENFMDNQQPDLALAILKEPKNAGKLRKHLSPEAYNRLVDDLETSLYLNDPLTPGKDALRFSRISKRHLEKADKALDAALQLRSEALDELAADAAGELEEVMNLKLRFADIMRQIVDPNWNGFDDIPTPLPDRSLYPLNGVGVATKEASEAHLELVAEARDISRQLGWDAPEEVLNEILRDPPLALVAQAGGKNRAATHSFAVYGLGGRVTSYQAATKDTVYLLESMINRFQTIHTKPGFEAMAKQTKWIARAWKSMATVSRVTFHPRNLMGGAFNNYVADVGLADYAWVKHNMVKYRRLLRRGVTEDAEFVAELGADTYRIIKEAQRVGVLGEGFASTEFGMLGRRGRLAEGKLYDPASEAFVLTQAGGAAMQTIEDFLRMAAFVRHYDTLGAHGARDVVNMVHFNYSALTEMEQKIKKWVPFYIWSKNNVPLQARILVERPDIFAKYGHFVQAVEDNFGSDEDNWAQNAYATPWAANLGVRLGNDSVWASLMLDPDLPLNDLAEIMADPTDPSSFLTSIVNMAAPHVSMGYSISEQNTWGKTNAPVGINGAMRAAGFVLGPLYDPVVSAQGDVQIGYGYRNALQTMFPILGEYSQLTGTTNNPEQLARLGIDPTDGVQLGERLRGAGVFLGRGLGVKAKTPNDTRVAAYQAEQRVREILDELKIQNVYRPEDFQGKADIAMLARELGLLE